MSPDRDGSMLTLTEYRAHLQGFNVLGCAVRNDDVLYFVAQEDYTRWPDWRNGEPPEDALLKKRLIPFIMTRPEGRRWSSVTFTGYNGLMIGFSPDPQRPHVVAAGVRGGAYVSGSGESYRERIGTFAGGGPARGALVKLKTIGDHLYVCGGCRSVGRRVGRDQWDGFTQQLPYVWDPPQKGFDDIDGFAEDDIYAVGGAGDVWHFDGQTWRRCAFPSNRLLSALCCAGDGFVYVGGLGGHVFKGRGDRWTRIHEGELSLPFRDMVWYEGRVWCTNDYGIWTIEGDELREAPLGVDVRVCAGNLSARDGTLLVAGFGGAAYLQDGRWRVVFHSLTMDLAADPGRG